MSLKRPDDVENACQPVGQSRRDLLKSAAGLVLATSVATLPWRRAIAAESVPSAAWGDGATLVSAIGAGTLAASSVAETVEAYQRGFGYVEHYRGRIPREMAEFWGVPAMAGRLVAVVGAPGYQRGMIRIVELGNDFKEVSYPETLGWIALEIHVRSPDELVGQLEGLPFVHTGGPATANDHEGKPLYRAAQFKGPSGEPLYMTQHMQLDELMPVGRNNVGPLFIQTVSTTSYRNTLDFYLKDLRMKMRIELDTPRTPLVESLGVPKGKRYKFAAVRAPEYCALQVDEYPEATPQRPTSPGCFPPGVSMCTLTTRDLDAVKSALTRANMQFAEIDANACPPFYHARALSFLGRAGERVEIVEVK